MRRRGAPGAMKPKRPPTITPERFAAALGAEHVPGETMAHYADVRRNTPATTGEPSAAIRDLCGAHGQQTRPTHSCICLKLLTVQHVERERIVREILNLQGVGVLPYAAVVERLIQIARGATAFPVADLRAGKGGESDGK